MSMGPQQPPAQGALTVLVTRRVKPGHEADFERVMADVMSAARGFAGHLGGQLVRPAESGASEGPEGLYHVVFAFDTAEHLAAWQRSDSRRRILEALRPHTRGESEVRQVSGLAHWFAEPTGPSQPPPPRWKVAVVTWLGIFPTVLLLFVTVVPWLAAWPLVPRTMVVTALVVLIMTWVVAPRLTRWLRPWLHPTPTGTASAGRPA